MRTIRDAIETHPFFAGLDHAWLELIAGCGKNVHFHEGQYLFRTADEANSFFVLRKGLVALEIYSPQKGPIIIQTEAEGEIVGASWLFPPYRCLLDARAVHDVQAIALDGKCIRKKCDQQPAMGYELMKRFTAILVERLQATRLRLLDMYGAQYQESL